MKAFYGFNFPLQTASKSPSVIVKVASGFLLASKATLPSPFFKSMVNDLTTGPFFFSVILNPKTA